MNECPFCGMHLNCNSDDVWICTNCCQFWIRITKQFEQIIKIVNKDNE